ncbi:AurF N-oxygenase family protein [Aldersonia kunmingensis]|uniref:AurF N-oxygenase family protein n=1 Tax=Aldersonia kunmingensis TaxID=408066 RepID=UPI00082A9146|nr:diiron oxygenase [Aldersonia kunmingensis]
MTTSEVGDRRIAVNRAGISTTSVKNVGDRQKTAQRLLRSTADRSYDGELDIDWDAPLEPDMRWLPDYRQSLYGTKLWDKLTDEQRRTLGMHEMIAILSFGIVAEFGLSTMLLRAVIENPELADDHSRYALAEVAEEARHSTMFGRLINKSGLNAYRQPAPLTKIFRGLGFIPRGPSIIAGTLLIEELLDRLQREAMNDPEMQPHTRQLMKIHVLEEARHITYAREELVRAIADRGRISNAWHRGVFAYQNILVQPILVNPLVYRSVGINPVHGFLVAFTKKSYREQAVFRSEVLMRYLYEVGMIKGPMTTRLYRMSRALPDDVLADLDRKKANRRSRAV